jgi:hypothetical protein
MLLVGHRHDHVYHAIDFVALVTESDVCDCLRSCSFSLHRSCQIVDLSASCTTYGESLSVLEDTDLIDEVVRIERVD